MIFQYGVHVFFLGIVVGFFNIHTLGNRVDMLYLRFGNPLLFVISAGLIVISLVDLARRLYGRGIKSNLLEFIGKQSLLIMAIHLPLAIYVDWGLSIFNLGTSWVRAILLLLVSCIGSIIIERYFPWMYRMKSKKCD